MSEPRDYDPAAEEPIVTTMTAPKPHTRPEAETRRMPPYHVIILNDEVHTFPYVIELLINLFGHPLSVAESLTNQIHKGGRAIVYTTHKEKAELKRDQVLGYGPDPWNPETTGPLGCYIEPAEAE